MKKILIFMILILVFACSKNEKNVEEKIKVTTTITYFKNLVEEIGKEKVSVDTIMNVGEDPHLYVAKPKDFEKIDNADLVFYGGLHLEGKMQEIFEKLEEKNKNIIDLSHNVPRELLIKEEENVYDPHIWFDSNIWLIEAKTVRDKLIEIDEKNKEYYENNYISYEEEIKNMREYIKNKIGEIPENKRKLITAHDAFSYFAREYGLEVKGIQGISTDSETSIKDITDLAKYIAENDIKAIFVESSVPAKSIEALKKSVESYNKKIEIGDELYSDSMGDLESGTETYVKTLKYNADTISKFLK